jgi:hypothetical protein
MGLVTGIDDVDARPLFDARLSRSEVFVPDVVVVFLVDEPCVPA